jgi:hypothetical protein
MTLTPAYGRDYKNAKSVRADFEQGKDFIVNDISSRYDGLPVNRPQLSGQTVTIRYNGLRSVVVVRA